MSCNLKTAMTDFNGFESSGGSRIRRRPRILEQNQTYYRGLTHMKLKCFAASAIAIVLAACSQLEEPVPEKPTPVYIAPEYDKLGEPSCPANTELSVAEAGRTVCSPTIL